jgi:hypothetical protein
MSLSATRPTDEQLSTASTSASTLNANAAVNAHDESILPVCLDLAGRVNAFLETDAETPMLKAVQE